MEKKNERKGKDESEDENGREAKREAGRARETRTAIKPKPEVYLRYSDSWSCRYERAAHPRSLGFPSFAVAKIPAPIPM